MSLNQFDEIALRLKQELRVTLDRDAAALLGFAPAPWAQRKKRGSFPMKELFALKEARPELNIDVNYVLTGVRQSSAALRAFRLGAALAALHGVCQSLDDAVIDYRPNRPEYAAAMKGAADALASAAGAAV